MNVPKKVHKKSAAPMDYTPRIRIILKKSITVGLFIAFFGNIF